MILSRQREVGRKGQRGIGGFGDGNSIFKPLEGNRETAFDLGGKASGSALHDSQRLWLRDEHRFGVGAIECLDVVIFNLLRGQGLRVHSHFVDRAFPARNRLQSGIQGRPIRADASNQKIRRGVVDKVRERTRNLLAIEIIDLVAAGAVEGRCHIRPPVLGYGAHGSVVPDESVIQTNV